MTNPYHYGSPVTGDQFAGRHDETKALTDRMSDGINVVVVSPRRYGKTSLLARAAHRVDNAGGSVVFVSAMGVADEGSLATQLLGQLYRARGGKWHRSRQAVPEFLSRLRVRPTVTFEGQAPTFTLTPSMAGADLDAVVSDVYAALADIAAPGRPAVLVVDEFQDVLELGDHLPGLFKALSDRHPTVSLVVAGSKRHVMSQLVLDETGPLYGMATPIALKPIPAVEMSDFLIRRATAGGKELSVELADRIVELAGPVPRDIQFLAYEVYAASGQVVAATDIDVAMTTAVDHEADFDSWRFESLSPGQRRVLRHLALEPVSQPYGEAFRQAVRLRSSGAVRNALTVLDDELGLASQVEGTWRLTSPFFAQWLRQRP